MNKTLIFGLLAISSIVVSISLVIVVVDHNNKFDNVNINFQKMVQSNFEVQMNHMIYNCIQDYKMNTLTMEELVNAINERTTCLLRMDVAEKIFNYQINGIQPQFTEAELKIVERIASQNQFPIIDELRLSTTNSTD